MFLFRNLEQTRKAKKYIQKTHETIKAEPEKWSWATGFLEEFVACENTLLAANDSTFFDGLSDAILSSTGFKEFKKTEGVPFHGKLVTPIRFRCSSIQNMLACFDSRGAFFLMQPSFPSNDFQ